MGKLLIPRSDWGKMGKNVYVVCPGCRERYRLDHDVAADGTVSPSLDCPTCPFHDHVRLAEWEAS